VLIHELLDFPETGEFTCGELPGMKADLKEGVFTKEEIDITHEKNRGLKVK
jgi:hypothetical protein